MNRAQDYVKKFRVKLFTVYLRWSFLTSSPIALQETIFYNGPVHYKQV